jgi:hypothetical protein
MDAFWGNLALTLNQTFNKIQTAYPLLVSLGSSGLQGLPSIASTANPYNSTDAGILLAGAGDMNNLNKLYQGLAFLASGSTANSGTITAVDGTHFGYNFQALNINKLFGVGQ